MDAAIRQLRRDLRAYFSELQERIAAALSTGKLTKHLPGQHDQSMHGNKGGGRLEMSVKRRGGFSYNPVYKSSPKTGFMVSVSPEYERSCALDDLHPDLINTYAKDHAEILQNPDAYMGGWLDVEAGTVYLDISINVADKEKARALAQANGQEGIYDLDNGQTIIVKSEEERRK
jgi:hypothetical protein